jgi:hypothetical protein
VTILPARKKGVIYTMILPIFLWPEMIWAPGGFHQLQWTRTTTTTIQSWKRRITCKSTPVGIVSYIWTTSMLWTWLCVILCNMWVVGV